MWRWLVGGGVLALGAAFGFTQLGPASASCFEQARPVLPTMDSVQANLTNGEAGQQIYQAVASGDAGQVEALLATDEALISTRTDLPEGTRPSNGNSADLLTAAVANCDVAMVQTLLQLGADPNGAIAGLALTYAVIADDLDIATVLLEAGAQPDAHDPALSTPLREALMFERTSAVTLLANYGADVDAANAVGRTPLSSALAGQNWAQVAALIEAGANPWQVYGEGILPAYMIFSSEPTTAEGRQIRDELLQRIEVGAPMWPPVNSTEVRARFLDGQWPTPEMREAGLFASEGAMRMMRTVGN